MARSGSAVRFERRAPDEPTIDFAALFRQAEAGDAWRAGCAIARWTGAGALLVTFIHAFDPERIVIGGGIMRSAATILPHLQKFVDDNAWTPWGRVQLAAAALGDDASLLGLSVLFAPELRVPVTGSNYDKFPFVEVPGHHDDCVAGWDAIARA